MLTPTLEAEGEGAGTGGSQTVSCAAVSRLLTLVGAVPPGVVMARSVGLGKTQITVSRMRERQNGDRVKVAGRVEFPSTEPRRLRHAALGKARHLGPTERPIPRISLIPPLPPQMTELSHPDTLSLVSLARFLLLSNPMLMHLPRACPRSQ